jgi:hypothetical protein
MEMIKLNSLASRRLACQQNEGTHDNDPQSGEAHWDNDECRRR